MRKIILITLLSSLLISCVSKTVYIKTVTPPPPKFNTNVEIKTNRDLLITLQKSLQHINKWEIWYYHQNFDIVSTTNYIEKR